MNAAAFLLGLITAFRRLRSPTTAMIAAGAVAFSTLAAYAERADPWSDAVGRALRGPCFGLSIPIATLLIVSLAFANTRADDALGPIAVLGGHRGAAALGAMLSAGVVSSLVASLTALAAAIVAHGSTKAPGPLVDAMTSAAIGALAAAAYTGLFGVASTFGRRGGGRVVALVADWLLGPMTGVMAVLFPRAHALNLLGGEPVLGLPQWVSGIILCATGLTLAAMAALRIRG